MRKIKEFARVHTNRGVAGSRYLAAVSRVADREVYVPTPSSMRGASPDDLRRQGRRLRCLLWACPGIAGPG